jgi:hypothetical protein
MRGCEGDGMFIAVPGQALCRQQSRRSFFTADCASGRETRMHWRLRRSERCHLRATGPSLIDLCRKATGVWNYCVLPYQQLVASKGNGGVGLGRALEHGTLNRAVDRGAVVSLTDCAYCVHLFLCVAPASCVPLETCSMSSENRVAFPARHCRCRSCVLISVSGRWSFER